MFPAWAAHAHGPPAEPAWRHEVLLRVVAQVRARRAAEARHAERATHLVVHRGEAAPDVVALREERVVEVDDDDARQGHESSSRETKIASSYRSMATSARHAFGLAVDGRPSAHSSSQRG